MIRKGLLLLLIVLALGNNVYAQESIDVLWYGGHSAYNLEITTLASAAHSYDPNSDGSLIWNLHFWNAGDPTPVFSDYDVLVIGSPDYGFGTGVFFDRLLASKTAIETARGTRTFLSGQDADWHYTNGDTTDNGPRGFIINAVNWGASGSGLGIVSLTDGYAGSGSQWWLDDNSFLKDELTGYADYFQEESVIIPTGMESFPINEGLTTAGLSNWGVSAHAICDKTIPGYLSINDAGHKPGYSVTIVTESYASGDTGGGDDDSDGDGVTDDVDICPGFDDNVDKDGDGVPDCIDHDNSKPVPEFPTTAIPALVAVGGYLALRMKIRD